MGQIPVCFNYLFQTRFSKPHLRAFFRHRVPVSPYSAHRKCLSHKPKCSGYDRQVLLICLKTWDPRKTTKCIQMHPNTANSKENSNDLRVCKYATCLATSIFSRKGAQHPQPRPLLGFCFPRAMGQQVLGWIFAAVKILSLLPASLVFSIFSLPRSVSTLS